MLSSCSPLAWGWSVITWPGCRAKGVLPTRVGMVRLPSVLGRGGGGSPHSRGDGPDSERLPRRRGGCSPLAWGWSVLPQRSAAWRVLPTRVGMVRAARSARVTPAPCSPLAWGWSAHARLSPRRARAPHSRGDGPCIKPLRIQLRVLPTRVGMVRPRPGPRHTYGVLPTRVGMVRRSRKGKREARRAPHSRGDGPKMASQRGQTTQCSPLAWGWSGEEQNCSSWPTCSPLAWGWSAKGFMMTLAGCRAPHSRGDGPHCPEFLWSDVGAPHSRGDGPDLAAADRTERRVLPTRVGMVRSDFAGYFHSAGVLPTRVGMVRGRGTRPCGVASCSPLAWGWSDLPSPPCSCAGVSPLAWGWSASGDGRRSGGQCSPLAWGWSDIWIGQCLALACSPLAWGWSARAILVACFGSCAPHSRGDGPLYADPEGGH